jgi:hypothetical protein
MAGGALTTVRVAGMYKVLILIHISMFLRYKSMFILSVIVF